MTSAATSALQKLQSWYQAHCDGDWEHGEGITIETIDNPGWSLEVDLDDTPLEHKAFSELNRDYDSETEWLTCFLRDGKFMGACSPQKLEEMIEVFLTWAKES